MGARRFTHAELASHVGATVDDLVGPDVRLLFVGINPGLWTAAVNAHFARRGNRFWPALHRAGITRTQFDVSDGMSQDVAGELINAGIGITNLVPYATARADELTRDQLTSGLTRLRELVLATRPRVVAILGKTAYTRAFETPATTASCVRGSTESATPKVKTRTQVAVQGRQPEEFEGAELWVLPNPSGINAHDTVDSLAVVYGEAAVAAGISLHEGPRDAALE